MDIVELNEMCRFLLYTPGQKFPAHRDGCFIRPADAGEKGKKQCMIIMYLDRYFFNSHGLFILINQFANI